MLSAPTSLLISPENAYLETLVLPESRYNAFSIERAFSTRGRLKAVSNKAWSGGYAFRPFQIKSTSREFRLSQSSLRTTSRHPKVSNLSAIWTPSLQEVLIGGVQQGKKQLDHKGASALSRSKMVTVALSSAIFLELVPQWVTKGLTYSDFKALDVLRGRQVAKEDMIRGGLCNWMRNGSDDFAIAQ